MSETSMLSCQSDAMRVSAVACMIIAPTEQIDTAQCSCREYMQAALQVTATARRLAQNASKHVSIQAHTYWVGELAAAEEVADLARYIRQREVERVGAVAA
eukprot:19146-Heterococcus_DN1.PRE.1